MSTFLIYKGITNPYLAVIKYNTLVGFSVSMRMVLEVSKHKAILFYRNTFVEITIFTSAIESLSTIILGFGFTVFNMLLLHYINDKSFQK